MSNGDKQTKTTEYGGPNPATDDNRHTTTSISLSNVLWLVVMVISVASFFFTFDTRITLLEAQIKEVPITSDEIKNITRNLNRVENKVEAVRYKVESLERYKNSDESDVTELNEKLETLIREVGLLEAEVNHIKEAIRRHHNVQSSKLSP